MGSWQGCRPALFVAVNTVKKHLTHVYAKVDVDGRADLAAQAARRDVKYRRDVHDVPGRVMFCGAVCVIVTA